MCLSAFFVPCSGGQIEALDRIQKEAVQFTNHTKDCDWENFAQRRKIAGLCTLFKAYCGERAWKATGDRLRRAHCWSRVDRVRKIRDREQRTDTGKYCFVNRTVESWNQLPAEVLGSFSCKPAIFRKRIRKAIIKGVK
jgi:hypothetical protein